MLHSYSTLFLHVVFATHERHDLIQPEIRERLYAYVGGIARRLGFQLVIAGGTGNHLHALILLPAKIAPATAIQKIKANSSRFFGANFAWQDGYGVFTVSASQVPTVKRYIANQEEHHRTRSFDEEFEILLQQYTRAPSGAVP